MLDGKWLAININVSENPAEREDLLMRIHANAISGFREKVKSWHFLWESAPFRHTLLVRFYGDVEIIEKLREATVNLLDAGRVEWKPDEEYPGEAETFGTKGWHYIMKVLHLGSEFAIDIIQNEKGAVRDEAFKQSLHRYLERWLHLFMNQLGTRVREAPTLFQHSVHRTALSVVGEQEYRRISKGLDAEIPRLFNDLCNEKILPLVEKLMEVR